MANIKHLGYGSLAIQLSEEKQIVLGPRETVDISVDELDSEAVQKNLREGLIALFPGEARTETKPKSKPNPN